MAKLASDLVCRLDFLIEQPSGVPDLMEFVKLLAALFAVVLFGKQYVGDGAACLADSVYIENVFACGFDPRSDDESGKAGCVAGFLGGHGLLCWGFAPNGVAPSWNLVTRYGASFEACAETMFPNLPAIV